MSTKAIREALRALRTVVVELGPMMPGHASALEGCDVALAEVEAIEKAARELVRPVSDRGPEYMGAERLMAAIARQGGVK